MHAKPIIPVHEAIGRRAAQAPGAIAFADGDATVTYHELDRDAHRIAGALQRLGGVAERPVALRLASGARQVAASLGVLRAGGYLLWFGDGETGESSRAILAESRPGMLLVDGDPAEDPLASWYGKECGGRAADLRALERGEPAAPPTLSRSDLSRPAYLAYTSGSTGRPKGVVQTHEALAQFAGWLGAEFRLGPGCRVAQWTAVEHDPAICEIFATLAAGGTVCPVPPGIRTNPERLVAWLGARGITFLQTVPTVAREILRVVTGLPAPWGSLECLVLMGEAVPVRLATSLRAALPSVRLANIYGPTETIAATWYDITGAESGTVPIGRPIPGRQVFVVDDGDRPCPPGVIGQIVVRSRYVGDGYLGGRAGAEAFRPLDGVDPVPGHRFYRTGDLGCHRADGLLEFRGRADLQVKLAGTRVELTDVETVLAEHETVAECAVVAGVDADGLVTHLTAYVVPSLRPPPDSAVWRAHLRRRFGTKLRLVSFVALDEPLPRNVSGKVDRRRLRVTPHVGSK
ncbi:amino acid adenylation domain-containing protein [Allorhizocola rhizosphaerae]|uniref:amino acid adenylation domain-containing protein n=1 Tax=Allorhizocola rhizosphaerae TaxID=1872709 RepID=UPI0013C2F204|nr:amino acid adenylation domain-containing protein [Allorhizocola rhizosphaerae]